jgi:hypothetical protein
MKHVMAVSALALAVFCGPAVAEQAKPVAPMGVKASQAECETLWTKADSGKTGKIAETIAANYITDPKLVNKDGDTTLEKAEFTSACEKGLIKQSALASPQTTGSTTKTVPSETSDRTPEKMTPTPPNQIDSSGGTTSDRTPKQ